MDDDVQQDGLINALANPFTSGSIITMDTTNISKNPPPPNAVPINNTTPSSATVTNKLTLKCIYVIKVFINTYK